MDIPYYKAIILRKTFPQLAELIDKTLNYYPRIYPGARYNGSSHTWTFPSGAKILFGSMQYAKDKIKYQGQAYDFIAFDELTHFTWEEYSYLFSRNRPNGPGTRVYIRSTANPGGVGHGWVKERFITAAPPMRTIREDAVVRFPDGHEEHRQKSRIFVPSTVFDNNVQYGEGQVTGRHLLVGGETTGNHYFTVRAVRKAVRFLKTMNAPRYEGSYWAIIHPDCSYDIQDDPDWKRPHEYKDTSNIYDDEIGKIAGVRFIETTEAKVFHADDLTEGARDLTVKSASGKVLTVNETITTADAAKLAGREVVIDGALLEIESASAAAAGSATITLKEAPAVTPTASTAIYPGEAGAKGRNVYSTLIMGAEAYGTTELTGGGLEHIVKPLGSAGTADPLNQRATVGWKATKVAERLVEAYMIRVETTSTFDETPLT